MGAGQTEYKPLLADKSWDEDNQDTTDQRDQIKPNVMNPTLRLFLALLIIVGMVASWIVMAELLQSVQKSSSTKFQKPFFMVYCIQGIGYLFFIILWSVWYIVKGRYEPESYKKIYDDEPIQGRSRFQIARAAAILKGCVGLTVGYTWYLSLPLTSVAANTGIYNSASAVVFFASVLLLKERVTIIKVISVLICLGGVVLVSVAGASNSGSGTETNSVVGYMFVIASTVLYGVYEVLYKKFGVDPLHPTSTTNTFLFLGMGGLTIVTLFWPFFFILHYTGIETFEWPNHEVWVMLVINMSLDCCFNLLLLLGINMTSPLFISVGSLLTVPASILSDKIAHNYMFPPLAWVGITGIVIGFLGLNLSELIPHKKVKTEMTLN